MQQSLTKATPYEEYSARRTQRPVLMKRAQFLFVVALVLIDIGCTWLAFYLAHGLLKRDPTRLVAPVVRVLLMPRGVRAVPALVPLWWTAALEAA